MDNTGRFLEGCYNFGELIPNRSEAKEAGSSDGTEIRELGSTIVRKIESRHLPRMGERSADELGGRRGFFRQRQPEPKIPFPDIPFPNDAMITAKHIGHCYFNLKKTDYEILGAYPTRLTLELVHIGIAHYEKNRRAYEAEIRVELKLNQADSLKDVSMTLPSLGFEDLETVEAMFRAECDEKLSRARENQIKQLSKLVPAVTNPKRWELVKPNPDIVSASEIASWAWCPESWRLQTHGHTPGNQKDLKRCNEFHSKTSVVETTTGFVISLGWWLIALAVVLVAFAILRAQ